MKQYCRYCVFCFEADAYCCSNHPKGDEPYWTEKQIKRANNCPNFIQTEDIITGREYRPREPKEKEDDSEQLKLF